MKETMENNSEKRVELELVYLHYFPKKMKQETNMEIV